MEGEKEREKQNKVSNIQSSINFYFMAKQLWHHLEVDFLNSDQWVCNKLSVKHIHDILQLSTQFIHMKEHTGLLRDHIWGDGYKNTRSQNYISSDPFPKRQREDSQKLMEKTWLHIWPLCTTSFSPYPSIHQFITFWHFMNAVIIDKDYESSKLNIWLSCCYSMHMYRGVGS